MLSSQGSYNHCVCFLGSKPVAYDFVFVEPTDLDSGIFDEAYLAVGNIVACGSGETIFVDNTICTEKTGDKYHQNEQDVCKGKRKYFTARNVASAIKMQLIKNRYNAPPAYCQLWLATPYPTVHNGGISAVAMATRVAAYVKWS